MVVFKDSKPTESFGWYAFHKIDFFAEINYDTFNHL